MMTGFLLSNLRKTDKFNFTRPPNGTRIEKNPPDKACPEGYDVCFL